MRYYKDIKVFFSEHKALKKPIDTIKNFRKIYLYSKRYKNVICSDYKKWRKIFFKFILAQPTEIEVVEAFYKANITIVKKQNIIKQDPVLICVIKNEKYRLEKLLEHYTKIGVKNFAILDNDSCDGTFEYLLTQTNVDVFRCTDVYTTNRREGWINRIIDIYGFNRWYILVDSDELLVYNNCEENDINMLIENLKKKNIKRLRAFLIDMYSKNSCFSIRDTKYEQLKYFDKNSYCETSSAVFEQVYGGPRSRIFSKSPLLTKYPVFYFDEKSCQGKSHFMFPYYENHSILNAGLLHYKFLNSDLDRYKEIANNGNYFNGSVQYKDYIEKYQSEDGITMFNENESKEFVDSNSIYCIPILERIDWNVEV